MPLHYLLLLLSLLVTISAAPLENNTTSVHRIDVTLTVAGMQESAASIEQTARQIALLTERLSDKKSFTPEDHRLITALTEALNRNAAAVNNVANALPTQLKAVQESTTGILDHAAGNVQQVVAASRSELIDPTLDRIETQMLLFILLLGAVLIGVIWFGLWQIRRIIATASETIGNITKTMHSVEKIVEKVNASEERWNSY